jgi:molybdenum cofactor synthesis domain-containing protein
MNLRFGILTASDRCSRGERPDLSGPALVEAVTSHGWTVTCTAIQPDDRDLLSTTLAAWADGGEVDVILTTGGTGFAPRDVMPEATLQIIDRSAPGLAEAMRRSSLEKTPHAMLSRAVSGLRGRVLIINLPGSPRAALENLQVVVPVLEHAVELLTDDPLAESHHRHG